MPEPLMVDVFDRTDVADTVTVNFDVAECRWLPEVFALLLAVVVGDGEADRVRVGTIVLLVDAETVLVFDAGAERDGVEEPDEVLEVETLAVVVVEITGVLEDL